MRFNPFYEREASVMSRALSLKAEKTSKVYFQYLPVRFGGLNDPFS